MSPHQREAVTRIVMTRVSQWLMVGANFAWTLVILSHLNVI